MRGAWSLAPSGSLGPAGPLGALAALLAAVSEEPVSLSSTLGSALGWTCQLYPCALLWGLQLQGPPAPSL